MIKQTKYYYNKRLSRRTLFLNIMSFLRRFKLKCSNIITLFTYFGHTKLTRPFKQQKCSAYLKEPVGRSIGNRAVGDFILFYEIFNIRYFCATSVISQEHRHIGCVRCSYD